MPWAGRLVVDDAVLCVAVLASTLAAVAELSPLLRPSNNQAHAPNSATAMTARQMISTLLSLLGCVVT